ncbi:MAG: pectin-derived oligosaccharide transport system permease protein [Micromonosporaceae bacterium]|jgi:multiple sugar transport system permease protein|nr:pectin-derived oligosaccharide transport system permease protein [Micromonosporaceae bacterium]MDT5037858.1 pectin-derived oligosaccharide transport system permease protein [Micromonosporaceae bacterium]
MTAITSSRPTRPPRPARRRTRRGSLPQRLAWHAMVIALIAVVVYPLLWLLGQSFKPADEIVTNLRFWPSHVTLDNYVQGWSGLPAGTFLRFFGNSLLVASLAVVGNVLACSLTGFALAKLRFRGRGVFFAIMIGTLLLPYHVLIVPQYVIFRQLGWIDTILPLVVPKFLATDAFFVFLMVQFIRGVPRELDDAAKLDGCGPWRLYWQITMPLARPALVTTSIFAFVWTWNDFFTQLVYLSSPEKYTVPLALNLFIDHTSQSAYGPMFAMALVSMLPIFLFFLAFQRLLVEGIATSGLKG